jgi:hypothetical protein
VTDLAFRHRIRVSRAFFAPDKVTCVITARPSGNSRVAGRVTTGLVAAIVMLGCLAACGGEGSDSGDDPAAPDFSATLNGPDTAEPGAVVDLSLSNVGRLRDSYQLTLSPDDGGIIKPRHLTLEPGSSAKVAVQVEQTPLTIKVEGVGGGPDMDEFTIK